MWGLRELADAAEDFADAAEEAVQHIIRIRNATGRAARACGTAASILAAGVGDAASAFAPLLRVLVGVFARPKLSRQQRRREIREAEHEAHKLKREILACLETSRAHRIPVRYPLPLPRVNLGCRRPRRRGHADATGNGI